ncbi:RNA polymerase sigma-70 factor, ECF subfamily [Maricaulis salignorans]|uniref:RNA polymerase sigma-70 factor, ECF subfamily n=2 Tax=Maricaulis salignorans TaxID=144026 RepID=A0A1G9Q1F4_9PROT|nr:RNA polymerase sigma-70 factor, ECF subfamily [Maricaulis salignorans]
MIAVAGGVTSAFAMFDGYGMANEPRIANDPAVFRARNMATDMTAGETDEALMARIADGDRAAAGELMNRRLPRIIGLATRMLNDAAAAEDVAQETFIRVWKAAANWQPGRAQVSTWMSRIAINLCHDRRRKHREALPETLPDRRDPGLDQEGRVVRAETENRIAEAMVQLPERQRQAMELVHFQELSNIDAADILSVSVDALESLLARGRRNLRSILIGEAEDLMSGYRAPQPSQTGTEP